MSTDYVRVQLTNVHPHTGEYGRVAVSDGKVTLERPAGMSVDMIRVELENCPHGVAACYARRNEMMIFPERRAATPRGRH